MHHKNTKPRSRSKDSDDHCYDDDEEKGEEKEVEVEEGEENEEEDVDEEEEVEVEEGGYQKLLVQDRLWRCIEFTLCQNTQRLIRAGGSMNIVDELANILKHLIIIKISGD